MHVFTLKCTEAKQNQICDFALEKLQCIDGVIIGNTCYKLIYRVGNSVTYERASSLCAFHGYGLAEIPTEEVYNAVYSYVKANWYILLDSQASTFIHIWLGSRYDVSSFTLKAVLKL